MLVVIGDDGIVCFKSNYHTITTRVAPLKLGLNSAVQHFESSVVIGDSANVGEVSRIDGMPVSIGRSFPRISRTYVVICPFFLRLKNLFIDYYYYNSLRSPSLRILSTKITIFVLHLV
jgi:hypothetical protein